jgi:hypothetical protein
MLMLNQNATLVCAPERGLRPPGAELEQLAAEHGTAG